MRREKGESKFLYRSIAFIFLSGSLLLLPAISFAQDQPCGGDPNDPFYEPCPLDTYVWVLAIAALIFGAVYLYRQQRKSAAKHTIVK